MRRPVASLAVLSAVLLAALVAAVSLSAAQGTDSCQTACNNLAAATGAAASFSNARDQAGLVSKAQDAIDKLDQQKFGDALVKLEDYKAKLDALFLANKPKIGVSDYDTLSALVDAAIDCVRSLIG